MLLIKSGCYNFRFLAFCAVLCCVLSLVSNVSAEGFPEDAPILILTDALCESDLSVRRDHAFVIPWGAKLPFKARGPVFEVK